MNPYAFEIIDKLGLPRPEVYHLNGIVGAQRDKFYLRYAKNSDKESCVVDKRKLLDRMDEIQKDILSGELVKIEDSFDSIAGCAVYINQNEIYGEYVNGHIVALLRRGLCNKRFFIDRRKNTTIIDAFQGFEAIQMEDGYNWRVCMDRIDKLDDILCFLKNHIDQNQKDLLLEILITEKEIVVCDAKYPHMETSWQGIKKIFTDNKAYILNKLHHTEIQKDKIKIDGLDIDYRGVEKNVFIGNGALLSHYITRNYKLFNVIKVI